MKVSGFTFVRNAIKFDYPVIEAITSILPLCDEFVIALGDSDDDTEELIGSIGSPKIKIIHTVWDCNLPKVDRVLNVETQKAFHAIAKDSTWAFYIQADEILHEKFQDTVRNAMHTYKDDLRVEGLLFNYLHFYGSYEYVVDEYEWYRREVRIIRNWDNIISYRDAQGFRKKPKKKLHVKHINADIYHYGWVRHPLTMHAKQTAKNYEPENQITSQTDLDEPYVNYSKIGTLHKFNMTHPAVMDRRIKTKNWQFKHDPSRNTRSLKNKIKKIVEKWTNWRIGEFRNYKII